MDFRIYPRRFPFAMINIMNHGRKVLKVVEEEDLYFYNCVHIERNGSINPYLSSIEAGKYVPQELEHRE